MLLYFSKCLCILKLFFFIFFCVCLMDFDIMECWIILFFFNLRWFIIFVICLELNLCIRLFLSDMKNWEDFGFFWCFEWFWSWWLIWWELWCFVLRMVRLLVFFIFLFSLMLVLCLVMLVVMVIVDVCLVLVMIFVLCWCCFVLRMLCLMLCLVSREERYLEIFMVVVLISIGWFWVVSFFVLLIIVLYFLCVVLYMRFCWFLCEIGWLVGIIIIFSL